MIITNDKLEELAKAEWKAFLKKKASMSLNPPYHEVYIAGYNKAMQTKVIELAKELQKDPTYGKRSRTKKS